MPRRFDAQGYLSDDGQSVMYCDYAELQTQYDALSELLEKANDARQDAEVRAEKAEDELAAVMKAVSGVCQVCAHNVVETDCCQTVSYCGMSQEDRERYLGCNWTPGWRK